MGADKHLNHEIANLLNINRAAYLSTTALFEAVRVLLNLEEDILAGVQTIPQPRKILKQESQ